MRRSTFLRPVLLVATVAAVGLVSCRRSSPEAGPDVRGNAPAATITGKFGVGAGVGTGVGPPVDPPPQAWRTRAPKKTRKDAEEVRGFIDEEREG